MMVCNISPLQDSVFRDMLLPLLRVASSHHVSFPGGAQARTVLCYKILDVLYLISLRIGFEMTRQHMTFVLQKFFAAFSRVYDERETGNGQEDGVVADGVSEEVNSAGVAALLELSFCYYVPVLVLFGCINVHVW